MQEKLVKTHTKIRVSCEVPMWEAKIRINDMKQQTTVSSFVKL